MKKAVFCLISLIVPFLPLLVHASYFSDNYNRPDSNSTGNGWNDQQVGSGTSWGISNNRGFSIGNDNGQLIAYRADIAATSGIAIKGTVSGPTFDHNYFKTGILSAQGYNQPGYYILLDSSPSNLTIGDESGALATIQFVLNDTDKFSYEWDITNAPKNWSYLYVWDADTASKPSAPTLSWTNNGKDFSPVTSGSRFYYTNAPGSLLNPTEIMYDYLYEVDPLDITPPSLSSVSISSNNASTTLAKPGDTITVAFNISEAIQTPIVTIGAHTASVTSLTSTNFTATAILDGSESDGAIPFSISSLQDLAGNTGFTTSTTTDNSSVIFDKTPPVINITSGPADEATSTSADISFGFSVDDAIASVSCAFDYATTSPCISPSATTTANGSHIFSISATDAAGNIASTSRTFSVAVPPPAPPTPTTTQTSSGGGGQPVGSSPTAPGFQTISTPPVPAAQSIDTALLSVPTNIVADNVNNISPIPSPETENTVADTPIAEPATAALSVIEDAPNAAAIAQSGFNLPTWAWPTFLILLLGLDGVWLYMRFRR